MDLSLSCLHPITVVNPRYRKDLDHEFGYPRDYKMAVPCGKCAVCRRKRSSEWHFRTYQEAIVTPTFRNGNKDQLNVWFCTFTFRDEFIPDDKNDGLRSRVAPFIRKWRDNWRKRHGVSPRYFAVTDIGSNPVSGIPDDCRLHLHLLIFNPTCKDGSRIGLSSVFVDPDSHGFDPYDYSHQLDWHFGRVDAQFVHGIEAIHYVSGYINNRNIARALEKGQLPKKHGKVLSEKARKHVAAVFVSNGLGAAFIRSHDFVKLRQTKSVICRLGKFIYTLPRYYRLYFYDDIWIGDGLCDSVWTRQEQLSADNRIRMLAQIEEFYASYPNITYRLGSRRFRISDPLALARYVSGMDKVFGYDAPPPKERSVFLTPGALFGSRSVSIPSELSMSSSNEISLDFTIEDFLAFGRPASYQQTQLFN